MCVCVCVYVWMNVHVHVNVHVCVCERAFPCGVYAHAHVVCMHACGV